MSAPIRASAQSVALPADTPPLVTALVAHLDRLLADSVVQARTGATDALQLHAKVKPDALARISDAELIEFVGVLVNTLDHVDTDACAGMWERGFAEGFVYLAPQINASDAEGWARWTEHMLWASILEKPIGRTAPPAEIHAALLADAEAMTPDDRERVLRAYLKQGTKAETCHFIREFYRRMLRLPQDRAAVLLRGSMVGSEE